VWIITLPFAVILIECLIRRWITFSQRGLRCSFFLPTFLNYIHNAAVRRQQWIFTGCYSPLLSTFANRCIRFYASEHFHLQIFVAFCSVLRRIGKEWMIVFCATTKYKTLPLFCFREHSWRGWRRADVFVIKSNIFKIQDNFILLGYGLDDLGFESRQGLGIFLLTNASRPDVGSTQPRIQWVRGALCLRVKRLKREADHPPPSSSEVKYGVILR
jgi:hypothetical protein